MCVDVTTYSKYLPEYSTKCVFATSDQGVVHARAEALSSSAERVRVELYNASSFLISKQHLLILFSASIPADNSSTGEIREERY